MTASLAGHDQAVPERVATQAKRADVASRTLRSADHCAQIDQSQSDGLWVTGRHNVLDQAPEAVVVARSCAGRSDSEAAREHADDVRIEQRSGRPIRHDQYSVRDITSDAGQRHQFGLGAWHASSKARAQLASQVRQACASMQKAKRTQKLNDVRFVSGGETRSIRVAADKAREHVRHKVRACPLQQELGDQNVKRIAGLTPGKLTPVSAEPCPHAATRPACVTRVHGPGSIRRHRGISVRRQPLGFPITAQSLSAATCSAHVEAEDAVLCATRQRSRA